MFELMRVISGRGPLRGHARDPGRGHPGSDPDLGHGPSLGLGRGPSDDHARTVRGPPPSNHHRTALRRDGAQPSELPGRVAESNNPHASDSDVLGGTSNPRPTRTLGRGSAAELELCVPAAVDQF